VFHAAILFLVAAGLQSFSVSRRSSIWLRSFYALGA